MTNPNPVNMAASVRQRLKNIADQSGRPFAEVLQWASFVRRMGFLEPPEPFESTVMSVRAFVMPVFEAIAEEMRFEQTWVPGVGWRD